MPTDDRLLIGKGETEQALLLRYANRHGLVAGATGTGKTVTLQTLAEGFSHAGVPVFVADVKGDLAGIGQSGALNTKAHERALQLGLGEFLPRACPMIPWDLFGEQGHPVRTTVSDMGPLLLARMLELNDTQEGVLNVVFRVADENGLLLLDLKDLRALLQHVAENASELTTTYGNVSRASVGAIQRQLLVLEQQGGEGFFGEPALELADIMRTTRDGRGCVSVLAADRLMRSPRLYATFLLWLLAELFEQLPEAGDIDRPKLVFFFDEAHLLFEDTPKALVDQVEQVVRLIRSKGVGVYFVTQSPLDVPEDVLGQLGNRVQHALRAFTPKDQKAVRAAAETFRANPRFSAAQAITELGVGEALVSTLGEGGVPGMVERALIAPPRSRLGPLTPVERQALLQQSPVQGHYERAVDRESAYEMLRAKTAQREETEARTPARERQSSPAPRAEAPRAEAPRRRGQDGLGGAFAKSVARAVGSSLGRQIVRGVLGAILGSGRR